MKFNLKDTIVLILIVGILALIIKLFLVKEAEGQAKPFLQDTAWITTTVPKDSLVLNFIFVGTKPIPDSLMFTGKEKSDSVGDVVPSYEFYDDNVYEIDWHEMFQTVGAFLGIISFLVMIFFVRNWGILSGKKD